MKLPKSFNNKISFIGALIASVTFMTILFFFALSLIFEQSSNYLGLFTFIILPVFLIIGLLLIPIGMIIRTRRLKRKADLAYERPWLIDLNEKRHRNAAIIFGAGTIILLFLSGIGTYEAFHYSESVEFCGKLCHQVMEPEYTAYQGSAHSRVACVECHVGSGAGWYVKSKMSGLRQVLAVIKNDYPHPIPTPITDLRPARETCEECHWPEKFYSRKLVNEIHYLADSANTEWSIDLQMKLAASHSALGITEGIHWHINPNILIEYIETGERREELPWVRYINLSTGDTIIYQDTDAMLEDSILQSSKPRTMDCMDCHTRPSHEFLTPQLFIDFAMAAGEISKTLPEIKKASMEVLRTAYDTREEAHATIESYITDYYKENWPIIYDTRKDDITQAIASIINHYSKNIFPEMKASWDAYPDHIGHIEYNGCFRCHNDRHTSLQGSVISRDCNLCHTILAQGTPENKEVALFNSWLEFKHPVDIDEAWKEMMCSDCHRYLY